MKKEKKACLTIISCGLAQSNINDRMKAIVKSSKILYGGSRLLDFFPKFNGEKKELGANFKSSINRIVKHIYDGKNVTVLASGDSMFFGITKSFLGLIPDIQINVIPNITAAQGLFSIAKIPWHSARFFTIHGRETLLPWSQILNGELSVIYCDHKNNASVIAADLIKSCPISASRKAIMAQNLGMEDESITRSSLEEIAKMECGSLAILFVLAEDPTDSGITTLGTLFGRDDSEFVHQNRMITHSEIRSVILSKLSIGSGVMWDIGAGSGSVGIEANLLCPELKIIAIEHSEERSKMIHQNGENFGINNIEILNKKALDAIPQLPPPRTVFIGGGGNDIDQILKQAFEKLIPGGVIVASAVLIETRTKLASTLTPFCDHIVSVGISRSKELAGSRFMKSENTIEIFIYKKPIQP